MADFPVYIIDLKSVDVFIGVLCSKNVRVQKTEDMYVVAQGSHYMQYEAEFENGGKLVFWINIYPGKDEVSLNIGNPSGRLGNSPLQLAFQILEGLGRRLVRSKSSRPEPR